MSDFSALENGSLSALHDRSYGFYRRQIILTVKDVPPDRVDDPYLIEKLQKRSRRYFFSGVWRDLKTITEKIKYRFTISERAKEKICTKLWNRGITLSLLCSHPGISGWKKNTTATSKESLSSVLPLV